MAMHSNKAHAVCPEKREPPIPIDHSAIFTHDDNSKEDNTDTVTVNISDLEIISAEQTQRLR